MPLVVLDPLFPLDETSRVKNRRGGLSDFCPRKGMLWDGTWVADAQIGGVDSHWHKETAGARDIIYYEESIVEGVTNLYGNGTTHPLAIPVGTGVRDVPSLQRMGYWLRKISKFTMDLRIGATYHSVECGATAIAPVDYTFEFQIPEFNDCGTEWLVIRPDNQAFDFSYSAWDGDSCETFTGHSSLGVDLFVDFTDILISSGDPLRPYLQKNLIWHPRMYIIISPPGGEVYQSEKLKYRDFEAGVPVTDVIENELAGSVNIDDFWGDAAGLGAVSLYRLADPDLSGIDHLSSSLVALGSGNLVDMKVSEINKYWET